MGGAWERMIRSVRQILKALLKEQVVCDEVLHTVRTEATNILSSRPLTRNSDDVMDEACDHVPVCHQEFSTKKICTVNASGDKRNTCQISFGNGGLVNISRPFRNERNGTNQRKI